MNLAQQRAQLKRGQILRSAMEIVQEQGYERATMEQIAAQLLMTKSALYYYFNSKEEILFECHKLVLQRALNQQRAILSSELGSWQMYEEMLDVHIEGVIEERDFFNLLNDPNTTFEQEQLTSALQLRKDYQSTFDELIERGVALGDFQVAQVFITRMSILGSLNWIQQWYREDGSLTKEQVKRHFKDVIKKQLL